MNINGKYRIIAIILLIWIGIIILMHIANRVPIIFEFVNFLPYLFVTIFVLILIAVLYTIFGIGAKKKSEMLISAWEGLKKKNVVDVDTNFELAEGEKIIFPSTPILVRRFLSLGARDAIITNLRITIGGSVSYPIHIHEFFGDWNLWHPQLVQIPKTQAKLGGMRDLLGGTSKIYKITLVPDRDKDFSWLKIKSKYGMTFISIRILHPHAKEIYEIFSQPIRH